MGLRFLRKILIPFAVLVIAASLGTLVLGRSHPTSAASALAGARPAGFLLQTSKGDLAAGRTLYEQNCSACHGADAQGTRIAPSLLGVGGAELDLWLSTGWMPLAEPTPQPDNKPPRFNGHQINQIIAFVTSLKPGGYAAPGKINLAGANVSSGFSLFTLNCAPCHTITGAGDALANGYHAPPLHGVTTAQIYEAVRTGPQQMPRFGPKQITSGELKNIIKYVSTEIEHPQNPGGVSLGGVGPVAEGFIGLFIGVGACLVAAFWVGDRTERDEDDEESEHGHERAVEGAHA